MLGGFHFGCFAHVGNFTFGHFCGVMLVILFCVLLGGFVLVVLLILVISFSLVLVV